MLGISISVSAWTALLNNPFARMQPSDIVLIGARGSHRHPSMCVWVHPDPACSLLCVVRPCVPVRISQVPVGD
jgi:hypothetical protein